MLSMQPSPTVSDSAAAPRPQSLAQMTAGRHGSSAALAPPPSNKQATFQQIQELQKLTGRPLKDCKEALNKNHCDLEAAKEALEDALEAVPLLRPTLFEERAWRQWQARRSEEAQRAESEDRGEAHHATASCDRVLRALDDLFARDVAASTARSTARRHYVHVRLWRGLGRLLEVQSHAHEIREERRRLRLVSARNCRVALGHREHTASVRAFERLQTHREGRRLRAWLIATAKLPLTTAFGCWRSWRLGQCSRVACRRNQLASATVRWARAVAVRGLMEKATRFHRRRLPPALAELREEPDHVFPPPRKVRRVALSERGYRAWSESRIRMPAGPYFEYGPVRAQLSVRRYDLGGWHPPRDGSPVLVFLKLTVTASVVIATAAFGRSSLQPLPIVTAEEAAKIQAEEAAAEKAAAEKAAAAEEAAAEKAAVDKAAAEKAAADKAKEEEDEQATFDREAREGYKRIKAVIMRKIMEGTPASAAEYLERDIHLWRLADADILKEYNWYTTVYLGEDTPPPVRGMAEMIVIKLGEVVKKPQQIRIKLMERRIEEEKAAKEAREHDAAKHASEPELRDKQNRMNQAAFEECRARWLPLLAEMEKGALSTELNDEERALARRVSYRAELKLVVTSLDEVRKLPPSRFTAMGTSGLKPTEMRAVLYAVHQANLASVASAMQFIALLSEKVADLPDFVSAPEQARRLIASLSHAPAAPQATAAMEEGEPASPAPPSTPNAESTATVAASPPSFYRRAVASSPSRLFGSNAVPSPPLAVPRVEPLAGWHGPAALEGLQRWRRQNQLRRDRLVVTAAAGYTLSMIRSLGAWRAVWVEARRLGLAVHAGTLNRCRVAHQTWLQHVQTTLMLARRLRIAADYGELCHRRAVLVAWLWRAQSYILEAQRLEIGDRYGALCGRSSALGAWRRHRLIVSPEAARLELARLRLKFASIQSLRTWAALAATRRPLAALAQRVALLACQWALDAWAKRAVSRRPKMKRALAQRVAISTVRRALVAWTQLAASRGPLSALARRVVHAALRRAVAAWAELSVAVGQTRKTMGFVLRAFINRHLKRGLLGWHDACVQRAQQQGAMRGCLTRLIERGLSRTWEAWKERAAPRRLLAALTRRVRLSAVRCAVAAWLDSILQRALAMCHRRLGLRFEKRRALALWRAMSAEWAVDAGHRRTGRRSNKLWALLLWQAMSANWAVDAGHRRTGLRLNKSRALALWRAMTAEWAVDRRVKAIAWDFCWVRTQKRGLRHWHERAQERYNAGILRMVLAHRESGYLSDREFAAALVSSPILRGGHPELAPAEEVY